MAQYQKLFKSGFIENNIRKLEKDELLKLYKDARFPFEEENILENRRILVETTPELKEPNGENLYEYENARSLFEAYKDLSRTQATDARMWTYMSHVQYWDYMRVRWPSDPNKDKTDLAKYILDHWYVNGISAKSISRHGIASLWWGAFVTYDGNREDKYELTKELFSRQDYKRHLLERSTMRHIPLVHAILEHILENKDIFEDFWAERVRFLTRKIHFMSGYKVLSVMSKEDIKDILENLKEDTSQVIGRVSD